MTDKHPETRTSTHFGLKPFGTHTFRIYGLLNVYKHVLGWLGNKVTKSTNSPIISHFVDSKHQIETVEAFYVCIGLQAIRLKDYGSSS